MHGQLTLLLTDRAGQVAWHKRAQNRIVASGRQLVAELFSGSFTGPPPVAVSHMAVGTDATAPADDQTALLAQRGDRNPIANVQVSTFDEGGVARVRVRLETVFDFDQANDPAVPLREAGIFTAATGGAMYNRVVFEGVTKTDAFRLTLFWDVVF
jgi:hypothetical protein